MRRRQRSTTTATGQHAVIDTLEWLVNLVVLAIPIVGLIACIIWAMGFGNLNRRNFARAALILMVAVILLVVIFGATMFQSLIKPYIELMQKV